VLINVTLSGNHATGGGGGGMYQGNGNASLSYVTAAGNTAGYGAGVYKDGSSTGNMYLQDTLLANNTTGNCDGVVSSLGHNMSSDTHCASFTQTGDRQNVALPLGPLADNGGPTLTHMPKVGNPAINGGVCLVGVPTDQRGVARPYGPACDVGAVEWTPGKVFLPVIRR
jgi:hypothetical protein